MTQAAMAHLLVVEDEALVRDQLCMLLSQEGHEHPGNDQKGMAVLRGLGTQAQAAAMIILTGYGTLLLGGEMLTKVLPARARSGLSSRRACALVVFCVGTWSLSLAGCAATPQEIAEAEQHKAREWATSEMFKSLHRMGLGKDKYNDAVAIVEELKQTDPGWFQRTDTSIQFDEIALMLNERLETGRIRALDDRIVNSLTTDERERSWLRFKQERHPERRHDVQYLQATLASGRDYVKRYQVQLIKMRHLYPNATKEELNILAHDEVKKERRAERERRQLMEAASQMETAISDPEPVFVPMMDPLLMPMINCTSMDLGLGMTSTSCY